MLHDSMSLTPSGSSQGTPDMHSWACMCHVDMHVDKGTEPEGVFCLFHSLVSCVTLSCVTFPH
jgi:hypothetical protein